MIQRYVFQWFTCRDRCRPSGRAWARQLGISHTWLQKLVRKFASDQSKMLRLYTAKGEPGEGVFGSDERARELRLPHRPTRVRVLGAL